MASIESKSPSKSTESSGTEIGKKKNISSFVPSRNFFLLHGEFQRLEALHTSHPHEVLPNLRHRSGTGVSHDTLHGVGIGEASCAHGHLHLKHRVHSHAHVHIHPRHSHLSGIRESGWVRHGEGVSRGGERT